MAYTVLARRYRSGTFEGVIGQEPISRTLCGAIANGRVAHAYLFAGTRGVGKTSMARILARALNAPDTVDDCPRPPDHDRYPERQCQQRMVDAIMRGDDLNVIEIDGASNRGVDEARQLIANASLAPTDNALYKIYIIDEVHMLTREAFNALLKTMEEPPGHVKFILCTTEPHKVPPTIQSRCQRFDFRNIATQRIVEHLRHVLEQEEMAAEDEVIWQIARLGNGSMRDALSLLDRIIASAEPGGPAVTGELVEQMLGLPPQERILQLVDALAGGDVAGSLRHTSALLDAGIGQDQVIGTLIERLRQLMLIAACGGDSDLVELSDDARKAAVEQAGRFDVAGLVHMIALCENLQRHGRSSSNPRALLDVTVVRLALAEKMADVTALLSATPGDRAATIVPSQAGKSTKKKIKIAPLNQLPSAASPVAEPPAPSAVMVESKESAGVWEAVLAAVAETPSLSWVSNLTLTELNANMARLSVRSGQRDLLSFAQQQRERLEQLVKQVSGRSLRIEIEMLAGPDDRLVKPDRETGGAVDQKRALALPLVKQVLEHFDATLIEARANQSAGSAESGT